MQRPILPNVRDPFLPSHCPNYMHFEIVTNLHDHDSNIKNTNIHLDSTTDDLLSKEA